MTLRNTLLTLFTAALATAPLSMQAASITASYVLCTNDNTVVVGGVQQGCQADASYLTGQAVGGTITTVDFNSGTQPYDSTGVATYTGKLFGVGHAPAFDNSGYLPVSSTTPETIDFNTPIVYFGLYWGSNDGTDNTVTFNQVSGGVTTTIQSFDGTFFTANSAAYVSFSATDGTFNQVVLSEQTGPVFETDNHAFVTAASAAAPEPSTFGIASLGMFGLAAVIRRARRSKS